MLEINKIHLGSCYELIKQIPDKSIDFIYTDIPYLYKKGGGSGISKLSKDKFRNKNDLKEISNGIDYSILKEFVRVLKNINIMIWCSREQLLDIMNFFNSSGGGTPFINVWCKSNPFPVNTTWLSDIEYCICFIQNHNATNSEKLPVNKRFKYYVSTINQNDKIKFKHPTIKPLDLVKNHIEVMTNKNDLVLDCFSGSGTTAVACKELERNFIGIEIDEKWHKISVDRLNGILANGQTSIFTEF